jgi:hypothetical protein
MSAATGGGNAVPFSSSFTNDIRFQLSIPAADLPGIPLLLTNVAFAPTVTGSLTIPTMIVSVGHLAMLPPVCDLTVNSNDLAVQYQGSHTYSYVQDTWSSFGIPLAFPYNGSGGLLVELRMMGTSGGDPFRTADAGNVQRVYNRLAGGFNATMCSHTTSTGIKLELTFLPSGQPQVNSYGAGCMGAIGIPSLATIELPFLGNGNFNLEVAQGATNSFAYLFAALAPANPAVQVGPCSIHLDLVSMNQLITVGFSPFGPLPTGATGSATFPLPIPATPSLQGQHLFFQAAITDVAAPLGLSLTNAAEVIIY